MKEQVFGASCGGKMQVAGSECMYTRAQHKGMYQTYQKYPIIYISGMVLDKMISEDHVIQHIIPIASEYNEVHCGHY